MTPAGVAAGSPQYAPPERVLGEDVGPEADVWSAGVLLYECLTGERPFAGAAGEAVRAILGDAPAPIRAFRAGVPEEVEEIVRRSLEKSPKDRYSDAGAMRAALLAAQMLL